MARIAPYILSTIASRNVTQLAAIVKLRRASMATYGGLWRRANMLAARETLVVGCACERADPERCYRTCFHRAIAWLHRAKHTFRLELTVRNNINYVWVSFNGDPHLFTSEPCTSFKAA